MILLLCFIPVWIFVGLNLAAMVFFDRSTDHYWKATFLRYGGNRAEADAEHARADALKRRGDRLAPWLRWFQQ